MTTKNDSAGPFSFYVNSKSLYCQYYAGDGVIQMSTGLKVDKEIYKAGKLTKDQKAVIARLQSAAYTYESDMRQSGKPTMKKDVEALVLAATGRKATAKRESRTAFHIYFDKYLEDVKTGAILNKGKRYSDSFIKSAGVVGRVLLKTKLGAVSVEKITEQDLQAFGAELTALELAKNTVATYMDYVISFIVLGRKMKRHTGPVLETRGYRVSREDIDHGQYLNAAEQAKMLAVEYEGEAAVWRDAFILGCQLGMRHSDLQKLTPRHRTGNMVNINTQKTTTPIWVPLNPMARSLWDKYDGALNVPGLTPFMVFAKQLGEDAGINDQVLFSRTEGGVKVERWVEKWELLGTHTMRRSFATNAYLAKVEMLSIMKITGHKSTASFMKYIRLTNKEHAELIAEHAFFK